MQIFDDSKNLISEAQNIYILPNPQRNESIASSLCLFYTLKELGKNANLLLELLPEKIQFLTPSLNYISYPKNFVISIPGNKTEISQVRYEKENEDLKIYLTIQKGNIQKADVSFYFQEPKADLLIVVGRKELEINQNSELSERSILCNTPILNIDDQTENKNFGVINLTDDKKLLPELIFDLLQLFGEQSINKNGATSLLTSIIISSDNFRSIKTSAQTLEISSSLIKKGAEHQEIIKNIYKPEQECE